MIDARFSQAANAELLAGIAYYDQGSADGGDRFRDAVEATVLLLRRHPKLGVPYRGGYRKRKVPGYPHLIFYYEYPTYLWIQAVYHGSQRPDAWMTRDLPPDDPA